MANRSYLYSIDAIPDGTTKPHPIRALSEFDNDIPIAHLLLASESPRLCPSLIWPEHKIAIVADFTGGMSRLVQLLNVMGHKGLREDPKFPVAVGETLNVLTSSKRRGKFALLEAGEIFDMSGNELDAAATRLLERDIPAASRNLMDAITGKSEDWIRGLMTDWQTKIGLYWPETLYYDFSK